MFGIEALNVAVGLIFVFLVLSLFATGINELIAHAIALRGRNLMDAITFMFDETKEHAPFDIKEKLEKDPLVNKLRTKRWFLSGKTNTPRPSYIANETFSDILLKDLFKAKIGNSVTVGDLKDKIAEIYPNAESDTRKMLEDIVDQSGGEIEKLKSGLEAWYDDIMVLATEWYKKRIRWFLFIIAMVISISLNANTFSIVNNFSSDPEALATVLAQAEQYVQEQSSEQPTTGGNAEPLTLENKYEAVEKILDEQLDKSSSIMGMGWYIEGTDERVPFTWTTPIGWLLTAFAISLGAPFWFNILRNAISLKNTAQLKAEGLMNRG